jgi:hypothetical protein
MSSIGDSDCDSILDNSDNESSDDNRITFDCSDEDERQEEEEQEEEQNDEDEEQGREQENEPIPSKQMFTMDELSDLIRSLNKLRNKQRKVHSKLNKTPFWYQVVYPKPIPGYYVSDIAPIRSSLSSHATPILPTQAIKKGDRYSMWAQKCCMI